MVSAVGTTARLRVQARVVSHAADDRCVIDAGSKSLSSDLLGLQGYGRILEHLDWEIYGLSEEHGHVRAPPGSDAAAHRRDRDRGSQPRLRGDQSVRPRLRRAAGPGGDLLRSRRAGQSAVSAGAGGRPARRPARTPRRHRHAEPAGPRGRGGRAARRRTRTPRLCDRDPAARRGPGERRSARLDNGAGPCFALQFAYGHGAGGRRLDAAIRFA